MIIYFLNLKIVILLVMISGNLDHKPPKPTTAEYKREM